MTGCLIGETRDDALERARQLYGRVPRDADFDTWLARLLAARAHRLASTRSPSGSASTKRAGCERVMLQHLLHADLEPVALIGRLGQQLV